VYSVNANIGCGSLLEDDVSGSSKISDIVSKWELGIKSSVNAALDALLIVQFTGFEVLLSDYIHTCSFTIL